MTKVVIGPSVVDLGWAVPALQREYPAVEFVLCPDRAAMLREVVDADVYLGAITREEVLAARRLKWVQAVSTGVNHLLAIPELAQDDVLLSGARGTHSAALAESVFGMILAFTRGIRESIHLQQQHRWAQLDVRARQVELTGGTLGLVGYGALAQAVARRALVFDMRVIAVDRYPAGSREGVEPWAMDRFDDLLRMSDYVVVAVPGGPATVDIIGAREIGLMKPTALLVGISRGGVINQPALAEALRTKRLAAAALDVFDPEPLPESSELWDLENLLITPHIAGGTQFEAQHVMRIFRENLGRFLSGDLPLCNQVDKAKGF
jgi:phosphoglycerate dehydrogenase-like enzyme